MNIASLFAIEGLLLQFNASINNFGNNLFATNLGATDTQLGLTQVIPNILALILLLPFGMWADKAKNIKKLPILTLGAMAFGYLIMFLVPSAEKNIMPLYFFALAFTMGGNVLYNAQWQNFFGEVVSCDSRNAILTHRNRFMFIISVAAPIVFGELLTLCHSTEMKLQVFRCFYLVCAFITFTQMFVLSRIHTPAREEKKESISLTALTTTIHRLSHSKQFMLFFIPIIYFYMTWQIDWSMWYIGQTQYLGLNESNLSLFNGIFNIGQLIAIGILSKQVKNKGADYAICFAPLGLFLCPLIMLFTASLSPSVRMPVFTVLLTVLNAGQCATNLCIVQILLRVSPTECRSLAISIYTLTITLTNSFMPYIGVRIYTALGADHTAFVQFFLLCAVIRILALTALALRYLHLKSK